MPRKRDCVSVCERKRDGASFSPFIDNDYDSCRFPGKPVCKRPFFMAIHEHAHANVFSNIFEFFESPRLSKGVVPLIPFRM